MRAIALGALACAGALAAGRQPERAAPPSARLPVDAAGALASHGEDAQRLASLAARLEARGEHADASRLWTRVIELDPTNARAHRGLGHHRFEGAWYGSYAEVAVLRQEEEDRRARERDEVRFGDGWIARADLPFVRMGWVEDEDGRWCTPVERAERIEADAMRRAGYERQGLEWVAPDELAELRAGLYKVGDEWLDEASANAAHSEPPAWWELPTAHFVVLTTLPIADARWAAHWAERVVPDVERMFGLVPREPVPFVVLGSAAQYNAFAAGDAATSRPPTEVSGSSSCHYAYFADAWFEREGALRVFRGTAVTFHDRGDPRLAPFGQHAVRHAAALACMAALDPSWSAVADAVTAGGVALDLEKYWSEKQLPRWLHYGVASYCERFFVEPPQAARTDGEAPAVDPSWSRRWALDNVAARGGLGALGDVFAMDLDPLEPDATASRIHRAGLLVAYLLDGGDEEAERAFARLGAAFRAAAGPGPKRDHPRLTRETRAAAAELEAVLARRAGAIEAFARR